MSREISEIPASAGAVGTTMDRSPVMADRMMSPTATIPSQEGAAGPTYSGLSERTHLLVSPAANLPVASGDGGGVGQCGRVQQDQSTPVDPAVIAEIREQWRRRQAWHRAEKSLTLQAKALCRRLAGGEIKDADRLYNAALGKGEHVMAEVAFAAIFPLVEARDSVAKHRAAVEKRLSKLANSLPVADWVKGVRGVGLGSLAAIIGEAGDLSAYDTPAKLWKRMGLAVIDGGRQRRVAGAAALDHGYSPGRRSVMWNVGASIIKAGGELKQAYDARKVIEATRCETKGHAHNRAQRYVEKRFLRMLWSEWRKPIPTCQVWDPRGTEPPYPAECSSGSRADTWHFESLGKDQLPARWLEAQSQQQTADLRHS